MPLKAKAQKLVDDQRKLNRKFPKVKSWHELYSLAEAGDERYQKLCIAALENLGGMIPARRPMTPQDMKWKRAYSGLQDYIMALEGEYGDNDAEKSVLDEVNFVRECIDQIKL